MKRITITLAVALSLVSGAAIAAGSGATTSIEFSTLSPEQLDALTSVLTGLPRQ